MLNDYINKHKRNLSFIPFKRTEENSSWGNLLQNYAKNITSKDNLLSHQSCEIEEIEQNPLYPKSKNIF
jgi:GH43 family beta-xylosidase